MNPGDREALWRDHRPLRPFADLCLGVPALDLKEPLLQTAGWAEAQPLTVDWRGERSLT